MLKLDKQYLITLKRAMGMITQPNVVITKILKKTTYDICADACGETDFIGISDPLGKC